MKTKLIFLMFFLGIAHRASYAQNAIPDSLFGDNSLLLQSVGVSDEVSSLLLQPDGLIICGGYDYDISQNDYHINMIRFDHCGDLDSSFGLNGIVHHKFDQRNIGYDYNLQQDGRIVVAGIQALSNSGSQQISCVSRFNADGSVDSTFNFTGTHPLRYDGVSSGAFYSIHVLPDSRIVCIGRCSANINGGVNGAGVMRFNQDGTLDTTFSGDGKVLFTGPIFTPFNEVYGHLLQNSKIIVTASLADVGSIDHFFSFCFDSAGVLDTTFGVSGSFMDTTNLDTYNLGMASAIQSDEKILLTANQSASAGIVVIRMLPSGVLDTTFGTNGRFQFLVAGMVANGIAQLSTGKILITGNFNSSSGCAVMLNQNGLIDSAFGTNGFRTFDLTNGSGSSTLSDLVELASGEWVAGSGLGDFKIKKYTDVLNVPHLTQNGMLLTSSGNGSFQWFRDGILLAGEINNFYTVTQNGNYTVELTDAVGCTYMSDPISITNVGIETLNLSTIQIYPNPAKEEVIVRTSSIIEGIIYIFDMNCRKVLETDISELNQKIDISSLSNGVYWVSIYSDRAVAQKKLIVYR
jgi:uncharacterized delta-60 repeat protein